MYNDTISIFSSSELFNMADTISAYNEGKITILGNHFFDFSNCELCYYEPGEYFYLIDEDSIILLLNDEGKLDLHPCWQLAILIAIYINLNG